MKQWFKKIYNYLHHYLYDCLYGYLRKHLHHYLGWALGGLLLLGILHGWHDWTGERSPSQHLNSVADCRMVRHELGESCIPQHPQRIVVMDQESLEILVALGLQPIATTLPNRVGSKETLLASRVGSMVNLGKEGQPNLEKIVQLQPDLILGMFILPQYYQVLSRIAPTVSVAYSQTGWQETLKQTAAIVHRQAEGDRLLAEYQQRVEQLQRQFSQTVDRLNVSIMRFYTDVHLTQFLNHKSFAVSVLDDIQGLSIPPQQQQMKQIPNSDWGYVNVSLEQLEILEADVLLIALDPGAEESFHHYASSQLWQRLEVVQRQRVQFVDSGYWIFGNVLSAQAILDDVCRYLIPDRAGCTPL